MAIKKLTLKPGVNRENTRYTNENGWYESDKVRFRQGTPEKIGGWQRISASTFLGVCRSLWNWATLAGQNLMGVGTNEKFYIENGGAYYDITPIYKAQQQPAPDFTTVAGSPLVTVSDDSGFAFIPLGATVGMYIGYYNDDPFSYPLIVNGINLSDYFEVVSYDETTIEYVINTNQNATSSGTAATPSVIYSVYLVAPGAEIAVPTVGWGSGTWGSGTWGNSVATTEPIRIWNQNNFGQDLIYGPRGGALYYWSADVGLVPISVDEVGASLGDPNLTLRFLSINLPDLTQISFDLDAELPVGIIPGQIYFIRDSAYPIPLPSSPPPQYVYKYISLTATGAYVTVPATAVLTAFNISPRGIPLVDKYGANAVPLSQNYFLVSDASRFVICFGTNEYLSTVFNPMLIRWSDQENATEWAPSATNQAGSVILSHGSKIITALQSRQEILVWTDSTLYSLQYLGAPIVWGTQLQGDNISIAGPNAAALASGVTYWMGVDKFYKYDGRISTLRCDLLRYIYTNINLTQADQIFASTNEGFNEVWFFYCSKNSTVVDSYVVYNYTEANGAGVWYYGSLGRTAWIDSGLRNYPVAATYSNNLVNHESGVDDGTLADPVGISAFVTSAQFDLDDGNNMAFAWRMLPDLTFSGSTDGTTPSLTMQLLPLKNSGSGYNDPKSVGGVSTTAEATITATQTYPIDLDTYTGQVNIRIRARQMAMKIASTQLGTQWQLGSPRIDLRTDGRR